MVRKIVVSILIFALVGVVGQNMTMAETGEMAGATNASETWRALQRLQTTATVLHTVAHPDDENGTLLTWLSRARGIRTGLYSTTRGEGGANLIGPELFDALGIVRTEEHLAAVRYYGIDLFFSSAVDFGYSKRLDETLEKWDYQMLLEDMVRLIRLYRPDVIIARFQGNTDTIRHLVLLLQRLSVSQAMRLDFQSTSPQGYTHGNRRNSISRVRDGDAIPPRLLIHLC